MHPMQLRTKITQPCFAMQEGEERFEAGPLTLHPAPAAGCTAVCLQRLRRLARKVPCQPPHAAPGDKALPLAAVGCKGAIVQRAHRPLPALHHTVALPARHHCSEGWVGSCEVLGRCSSGGGSESVPSGQGKWQHSRTTAARRGVWTPQET